MSRIAELPAPWRYLVLALLALALIFVLLWLEPDEAAPAGTASRAPVAYLHLKRRPGVAMVASLDGYPARPVFQHFHATTTATVDARSLWLRVEVPRARARALLATVLRDPGVDQAFLEPVVSLPAASGLPAAPGVPAATPARAHRPAPARSDDRCPITTPSFESYQGYLGPAPHGIDAPAAWQRGIRGAGVQFADVEGGWNAAHEDLPGDRIVHAGGRPVPAPSWRAHGTAVLGEVVGVDNGRGVMGIAPDVDRVYTSSIGGTSVADAIDTAAASLRAGDVLLIELQATGPRGRFLPVEYWDDNYDAIVAATRRGVVVIEAAGNGGEDLDHRAYRGKLARDGRDSGAIMVGAGGPPRPGFEDRVRLDFSNYGSRVDVQGWGRQVATLDYGDLQRCAGADRHYTGEFAGTSSASPIVAGAAVLLESAARARGDVLAPARVRALLRETGTPQAGDAGAEPIGPRPDLARALDAARRALRR